jgi:His-Xaa-Ser system protein HxsD
MSRVKSTINVSGVVYSRDIVLSVAHRLTSVADFEIAASGDDYVVQFETRDSLTSIEAVNKAFHNMLIDESLRAKLRAETEGIRNLIVAQSFSNVHLIDVRLNDADYKSDSLGFSQPDPSTGRSHV